MELSQGMIDGVKILFSINLSKNTYDSSPIPQSEYFLMALDNGKGKITIEQFNKRLFHLKDNILKIALDAHQKNKDPIAEIAHTQEIKNWMKELTPNLLKDSGKETIIKINEHFVRK